MNQPITANFGAIRGLFRLMVFLFLLHSCLDALMYHDLVQGSFVAHKSLPSWVVRPYTSFRLSAKVAEATLIQTREGWGYVKNVSLSRKKVETALHATGRELDETLHRYLKP